jgi:hypothetical protein
MSLKQYGIYSFGFLYSAELLVNLSHQSWERGLKFKCATFTDLLITLVLKQKLLYQEWLGNTVYVCMHVQRG